MQLPAWSSSLVVRNIVIGILTVIAGGAARYVATTWILDEAVRRSAADQMFALANYVAGDVDNKIQMRRHYLEEMARDLGSRLPDDPLLLQAWLAEHQRLMPLFSLGLALIPRDGHGVIADAPAVPMRARLEYGASDWFVGARDRRTFVIGRPQWGRASQRPQVAMAVPVIDPKGAVTAVLVGACDLDSAGFLDLVHHNRIGMSGGFLLIAPRDGLYVASSRPSETLTALPEGGRDAFLDAALRGFRGSGAHAGMDGQGEQAAVAGVPSADWLVMAYAPDAEVFSRIRETRSYAVVGTGLIGLLMVLGLSTALYLNLRPMRRAAEAMREMADGEQPLAPLPVARPDEVGRMVEGFNYLVGKLRASEQRLAQLAHCDSLTGLPNRRAFLDESGAALRRARATGQRLAVLFIDLDGFKPINDRHGHEIGDRVLASFARRLRESVRPGDLGARFGGDEFIVLLEGIEDRASAEQRAGEMMMRLGRTLQLDAFELRLAASVGVAMFPDDADDLDGLIAHADAAMYAAKRAGPGSVRLA